MANSGQRIFLATGNAHKLREMQALADAMAPASAGLIQLVPATEMPAVAEDTGTFTGNARQKALALQAMLPPGTWVLADDSGLCVDALGGLPGVESAYYAGRPSDGAANLRKLAEIMRPVPTGKRGAHFVCVLVLVGGPAGEEFTAEEHSPGSLRFEPAGSHGFGYDPLFEPEGFSRTFAELTEEEKNRISHRARAFARVSDWLRTKKSGGH